jgi:hypothetical protein
MVEFVADFPFPRELAVCSEKHLIAEIAFRDGESAISRSVSSFHAAMKYSREVRAFVSSSPLDYKIAVAGEVRRQVLPLLVWRECRQGLFVS